MLVHTHWCLEANLGHVPDGLSGEEPQVTWRELLHAIQMCYPGTIFSKHQQFLYKIISPEILH